MYTCGLNVLIYYIYVYKMLSKCIYLLYVKCYCNYVYVHNNEFIIIIFLSRK